MKPHEEEWEAEEVIVMHNRHDGQKDAREILGHAAPDMARALLGLLETAKHGVLTKEKCDAARAALTKAGVPLP